MIEQSLLNQPKGVSYKEEPLPKNFLSQQKGVDFYWQNFKKKHTQATREPKLRINRLEFKNDQLNIFLSRGIDFANIVYADWKYVSKGKPNTPNKTYKKVSPSIWITDSRFPNAASVGAIIRFGKSNPLFIFGIRSKKAFGSPGTISLPVNGYADPIKKSKNLLLDNLYKETEEEVFIKKNEIRKISFVGPAQMRGKSCDLIWTISPKISYKSWFSRWKKNTLEKELSGIVSLKSSQIKTALFSGKTNMILKNSFISDELRKIIKKEGSKLNPLLTALKTILTNLK